MRIGAALALIAVGAILRFALTTVLTHGVYLHTVGDILMAVGVLGLIMFLFVWGPWGRNRPTASRQVTSVHRDGYQDNYNRQPGTYVQEERRYEDQYPN